MASFGLIGAAGYIAPRHLKAIRDTGNILQWIVDPSDSVGIIDQYFPKAEYYRDLTELPATPVDYVTICSPNYLHFDHIRSALEMGADVICEKPLITDFNHLEDILLLEKQTGRKVNTIMQLRLHPVVNEIQRMMSEVRDENRDQKQQVKLEYITARGRWYLKSWKGMEEKSGGIAMNIGIHLFDLLIQQFGPMEHCTVIGYQPDKAHGILQLQKADVEWFLSIDENDLPNVVREKGKRAFRNITLNNRSVEFTEGFTELHTESYRQILAGNGFDVNDVRESLRVIQTIRNC